MYDLKSRQKSREKFTTVGFPGQNYQPNHPLDTDAKNGLTRPPALTGVGQQDADRESHRTKRSASEKRRTKQTSLMEAANDRLHFEPVDTDKFKTIGTYGQIRPMEREHSEKSKRSSKSKRKSKDTMLLHMDEPDEPITNRQSITNYDRPVQRPVVELPNFAQQEYKQPQPAYKKQVYDLTAHQPQEQPSSNQHTDRGSERSSSKGSKKKPKEGTLFEVPKEQLKPQPFTFGDVLKKEVKSIPSSTPQQMDYSQVNSIQFNEVSRFDLPRENRFTEDSKLPSGQRKRKEANRLGNLFEERNKSRSIENISRISEATSKQRSRIGELFREKREQSKGEQSSVLPAQGLQVESSKRLDKLQKPFGDQDQPKEIGADLCNYVKAYQAAKPLEVKIQQQPQKVQQKEMSPDIFKEDAPSKIPYAHSPYSEFSPSPGNSPLAPDFVPGPILAETRPEPQGQKGFPSVASLMQDNSPSHFNQRNSILRYSQTPPKDEQENEAKQQLLGKDSLFFNLENDEKPGASRKKKGLHVLSSKEGPIIQTTSKTDLLKQQGQSVRSGSHDKKKVKETTLITKPKDGKYFDFKVRNSPNKINDSYYSDDAPPLVPEPPQSQREAIIQPPAVITFDDEPPKTVGADTMAKSLAPLVSRTTDNFYPPSSGNSSIYEPSVQSAGSSIRPPSGRPPSCKKSISSKRSSSKDGSLLDSSDEPELQISKKGKKLTLNEVAQLRKGQYPNRQDPENSRYSSDRSSSKRKKREFMESAEGGSHLSGKSRSSDGSERSRSNDKKNSMIVDSSRVSEWLPSQAKEVKKAKRAQEARRQQRQEQSNVRPTSNSYNKSSLHQFIKPAGPVTKQGLGSYYLQDYITNHNQTEEAYDDYFDDEPEERVNFNQMFERKPGKKKSMRRTEAASRY